MKEAEAAITVTATPTMGASEVLVAGLGPGALSGSRLGCSPSLVLLLRPLPLLLFPPNQVQPLLMPLLQLLLVGGHVLGFAGWELFFDELGGQSQKAS